MVTCHFTANRYCKTFPECCETFPVCCETFPNRCETFPVCCETFPTCCESFPDCCESFSECCDSFPVCCETFLVCCETFPKNPFAVKWESTKINGSNIYKRYINSYDQSLIHLWLTQVVRHYSSPGFTISGLLKVNFDPLRKCPLKMKRLSHTNQIPTGSKWPVKPDKSFIACDKRLVRSQNDLKRTLRQISLLTSEKPKWDYPLIQICFIWHTRLLLEPCLHFFWRSVYGSVAVGRMTLMNSIKNRKFSMNLRLTLGYSVSFF